MSKQATQFQKKIMSIGFRGKGIFKPLNTGYIDEHASCIREWIANIFFYSKNGTTIMIDAGYNYDRLQEKMSWIDIHPDDIHHILITHQDTDHVGAMEEDSEGLFRDATLYIGRIENEYLEGRKRRRVGFGTYKLPQVNIPNPKVLLEDGEIFYINDIKVEAILVPGHTWGHMVYLIDDAYLFTGDTIWFGADGGYSFISTLAEDNKLSVQSLIRLEKNLKERNKKIKIITGHTGWTDDLDFAFAHKEELCGPFSKRVYDPDAPYDGYDESEDTEENARNGYLKEKTKMVSNEIKSAYHSSRNIYDAVLTQANPLTKLYTDVFWGGVDDVEIAQRLLSYIPDDFNGKILDVPVGTAVFTAENWKKLKGAEIICLDYSEDMLEKAENRLSDAKHVTCMQGDVGNLPFGDESMDIVFSMNGFHAFPDKEAAYAETYRVLKKGGMFISCFYIAKENRATDLLVQNIYSRAGWFTPPFETKKSLTRRLKNMYAEVSVENDQAIALIVCRK